MSLNVSNDVRDICEYFKGNGLQWNTNLLIVSNMSESFEFPSGCLVGSLLPLSFEMLNGWVVYEQFNT